MTNIAVFCAEECPDPADGSMERNTKPGQHLIRAPLSLIVDGVCLFRFIRVSAQPGPKITLTTTRVCGTARPMSQTSCPSREEISSTSLARSACRRNPRRLLFIGFPSYSVAASGAAAVRRVKWEIIPRLSVMGIAPDCTLDSST